MNKTPDEMIKHFIANEDFDKAKELLKMFFPKIKKDHEQREKYYGLMYDQLSSTILKGEGRVAFERRPMFNRRIIAVHRILDDMADKPLFLARVHGLCTELLERGAPHADRVVIDMVEYFGERREIGSDKRPEFTLTIPSALIKQKIESMKSKTPFFTLVDFAENMILPQ